MKIMMVHNKYQQAGGEDKVFGLESKLLEHRGHDVHRFIVDNNHIQGVLDKLKAGISVSYSNRSRLLMLDVLDKFKPDIAHVHNFFPVLTPSIFDACSERNVPVVHTLHNYRLICPSAVLMINGEIYEKSVTGSAYWAVLRKPYRDSYLGTYALARMIEYHKKRGTWQKKVNRFIALTEFSRSKYIAAGLPAKKIYVKPNFIHDPIVGKQLPECESRHGALFVGRLAEEKGIRTLAKAWREVDYPLTVAGEGPLYRELRNSPGNINFLGNKDYQEISNLMSQAAFLVMPSECYEGFPIVLLEAYAHGLPVVASDLGGLSELVKESETGLKFKPRQIEDLVDKLQTLIEDPKYCSVLGARARRQYETEYTPETNYTKLLNLYKEMIDENDCRENRRNGVY